MALTAKQRRFVEEFLVDGNATQAALRAGYSSRTAGSIGFENLKKPEIAEALAEAQRARSMRAQVHADRVLEELARVAFANLRDVVRWEDSEPHLRPEAEITADAHAAIESIKVKRRKFYDGDEENLKTEVVEEVQVKLHSKTEALRLLANHLGIISTGARAALQQNNTVVYNTGMSLQELLAAAGSPKAARVVAEKLHALLPPLDEDE